MRAYCVKAKLFVMDASLQIEVILFYCMSVSEIVE